MTGRPIMDVEWTGTELVGCLKKEGQLVQFSADREAIHQHAAGFSDVLTWEIERFKNEIFEKLIPYFERASP